MCNYDYREMMKELSESIINELKELYIICLSYNIEDEDLIQNHVENVINFITEETKSDEEPVLQWKTQMFLKYLEDSNGTELNHNSKSFKKLFSHC
jgi:hypothetical protein